MENKTTVIETISTVNRDSGFSNNIMAYRLGLIMESNPPTPSLVNEPQHQRDRLQIQDELRTTLTQKSQQTEAYKQNLKNKYYQDYLQKFGVTQQSNVAESNTSNRVDKLIEIRKQSYVQRFLNAGRKQYKSTVKQQPQEPPKIQTAETETVKTSLISAAINTVITKGKDTEQGRVYDGIIYRLQLLAQEGMQRINIIRKQGKQGLAFSAHKDDGNEFNVTLDKLSLEEKNRLIAFDRQVQRNHSPAKDHNKDIELDG
ncbi:hypothetical protein H6G80_30120 [Nostoc sp. FACHB-87]|uniref:hypothetical protein n=1 Tax=Nostocales TaxID=1161 RepID=UPI001683BCDF|nr:MULTISPECIES: hypothetical protein [Nostocales]MBD2303267.1 hypothetical protein [Nostoc sp. FACHB-190]MBD2458311.1 hypothetical protein [Nostoc sp. FACHB-87]MBD2479459.1 hypothetical protein [Anabaena sp. FACHB-83]MBD2491246.1 hypothetical protein [Aulosira sp. FACHB-615]